MWRGDRLECTRDTPRTEVAAGRWPKGTWADGAPDVTLWLTDAGRCQKWPQAGKLVTLERPSSLHPSGQVPGAITLTISLDT